MFTRYLLFSESVGGGKRASLLAAAYLLNKISVISGFATSIFGGQLAHRQLPLQFQETPRPWRIT